jgi:imidazole glycerol-phosphate synthase subunit HisH
MVSGNHNSKLNNKLSNKIGIIDYGMGNLWSVASALEFLDAQFIISSDPAELKKVDALILPGVGSFRRAMLSLQESGLEDIIKESVHIQQKNILGICLGMQLLCNSSNEDGMTKGLGLIDGKINNFDQKLTKLQKIPHIGFNTVDIPHDSNLYKGFNKNADFYFVHSYRLLSENLPGNLATCEHGEIFVASYEDKNIFASQFHPEKSQTNGLMFLKNFLQISKC